VHRAYDRPKDDDFFYSMHSDPNVFLNVWKCLPQPVSRQFLEILRKTALEGLLFVVICKIQNQSSHPPAEDGIIDNNIAEGSEPIGVLLIHEVPSELRHHRSVTFGIEIKPGQQGYGYGTETVRWALDWAFKTAGLH
jgi:hypothetical protein